MIDVTSIGCVSCRTASYPIGGFTCTHEPPQPLIEVALLVSGRFAETLEVRFIEVKGRAGVGVVALAKNEYSHA